MVMRPWMYISLAFLYSLFIPIGYYLYHNYPIIALGCVSVIANLWMANGARKFYATR